ncbi:MAG: tRNA 2-thiocytidine(32) synthetase TtcA [Myxococcota bacterium]
MSHPAHNLEKSLARSMMRTVEEHGLIRAGDHILVAISGGKDSYALLHLLWRARARAPFAFQLTAVHVDQGQPGYHGAPLADWLRESGIPHEIIHEDTYTTVVERTPQGGTYCAVCSRLRRGILYSAAARLGCNKIALGHHRDDALETFLMNMFFTGKLQAMPARYTTDDGRFEVIRPLIDVGEEQLAEFARLQAFPILPCNLCGSQEGLQRDQMRELLNGLAARHPQVRHVMARALKNVRPTHLLDRDVLRAWEQAGGESSRRATAPAPGLTVLATPPETGGCAEG